MTLFPVCRPPFFFFGGGVFVWYSFLAFVSHFSTLLFRIATYLRLTAGRYPCHFKLVL